MIKLYKRVDQLTDYFFKNHLITKGSIVNLVVLDRKSMTPPVRHIENISHLWEDLLSNHERETPKETHSRPKLKKYPKHGTTYTYIHEYECILLH